MHIKKNMAKICNVMIYETKNYKIQNRTKENIALHHITLTQLVNTIQHDDLYQKAQNFNKKLNN